MSFLGELKRRNVFRVGIAYLVGAWLLAQIADLALDVIGAPDVALRTVMVILALGFIPTVVFAWVYEMTPEGVKKASEIDPAQSITHHTGKKLDIATIVLLIGAVGFVVVERYLPGADRAAPIESEIVPIAENQSTPEEVSVPATAIAVLPFANRSNQSDDLYFTDGIHDDLLTQLAKIHGLTVISRTSVMKYRDSTKNLRQIGAELNVGSILEGGVQKVGDRVRINAQLIDVASDRHLWAESFDRELTAENVFELQSEIAQKIVTAISGRLSPEEVELLTEVPTRNLEAYESYLKARKIIYSANYSRSQEAAALPLLERAVELDPGYADAYVMLANQYAQQYWRGIDTSEALLNQYRDTLDRVVQLKPGSAAALRAMANYHYRFENDYAQSLQLLEQALRKAPGDVELHSDMGLTLRRLGRWDESIASFRKATELDPANKFFLALMVETMASAFRWQEIIDNTVPLADADRNDLDIQATRAVALLNLTGNLEPLKRVFRDMHLVGSTDYVVYSAYVHWLDRDPDTMIEVLSGPLWKDMATRQMVGRSLRLRYLGDAWRLKGDDERARGFYEELIGRVDEYLDSALQVQCYAGSDVAQSLAHLGQHDEARGLIEHLMEEIPPERDALLWGTLLTTRAMVRGLAGDHDGAIDDLAESIRTPTAIGITAWDLHFDPNWDFLRDNPRFVELATPDNLIQ